MHVQNEIGINTSPPVERASFVSNQIVHSSSNEQSPSPVNIQTTNRYITTLSKKRNSRKKSSVSASSAKCQKSLGIEASHEKIVINESAASEVEHATTLCSNAQIVPLGQKGPLNTNTELSHDAVKTCYKKNRGIIQGGNQSSNAINTSAKVDLIAVKESIQVNRFDGAHQLPESVQNRLGEPHGRNSPEVALALLGEQLESKSHIVTHRRTSNVNISAHSSNINSSNNVGNNQPESAATPIEATEVEKAAPPTSSKVEQAQAKIRAKVNAVTCKITPRM